MHSNIIALIDYTAHLPYAEENKLARIIPVTLNYSGLMCILNFLLDEDKGICNDPGLSFLPLSILKKTQVAACLNCYFLNCYFYSLKTY